MLPFFSGEGELSYSNGSRYRGTYRCNHNILKFSGVGTLFRSDGTILTGDFEYGRMTRGHISYPSGSTYEGQVNEKGLPSGCGTYVSHSGISYVGQWNNGKYSGQGKLVLADGSSYEGQWKDGKKDGILIEKRVSGTKETIVTGEWHRDKLLKTKNIKVRDISSSREIIRHSSDETTVDTGSVSVIRTSPRKRPNTEIFEDDKSRTAKRPHL